MGILNSKTLFLLKVKCSVFSFLLLTISCFLFSENIKATTLSNHRGINVYMHSNPTEDDFSKLNQWGVNTIRLFIHANQERRDYDHIYKKESDHLNEKAFIKLDHLLNISAKHNIKVIIATATFPGSTKGIWSNLDYWRKLESLYAYMAKRYLKHPAVIGYHPIDEPSLLRNHGSFQDRLLMRLGHWKFPDEWRGTPKDYFKLVEKVGMTINRIDPNKIVVVSGIGIWGFADNYAWMEPVNIHNAVYSFNPYIPHKFANSGKKGKPKTVYNSEKERTKLFKKMLPVKNFSKKHNAKIIVVGFGLSLHTEGMGARDWMNDMLGFFEENKWSWTYFSYGIPFRSPEVFRKTKDGKWLRSENTERLSVLKKYWQLNLKDKLDKYDY